jgi:hypothetical protein
MNPRGASSVTRRTAIFLAAFLIAGCEQGGGREYREALSAMVRNSDRIIVTEHSSSNDALDPKSLESLIPEDIVYGTRELSPAQKKMFLDTIERLDPKTQDEFLGCATEVHHTVSFFAHGKLMSTMGICFQCGEVLWDGTKATPPWSLYAALASVVTQIGLEPKRDWAELAKQHLSEQLPTGRR